MNAAGGEQVVQKSAFKRTAVQEVKPFVGAPDFIGPPTFPVNQLSAW